MENICVAFSWIIGDVLFSIKKTNIDEDTFFIIVYVFFFCSFIYLQGPPFLHILFWYDPLHHSTKKNEHDFTPMIELAACPPTAMD